MEPKRSGNATCLERAREREYWQHCQRILSQNARINNSTPSSFMFRRPIGEGPIRPHVSERNRQINLDNTKLVERMLNIMQTQGGIDNSPPWRDHNKAINSQRVREVNQRRIADENLKLLGRLERVRPVYNAEQFELEHAQNEEYAARISRYPYRRINRYGMVPYDKM
ncbi:unnamed protein product [Phytomonas sp. EM1]|nr:unnamed protein product [Phytomonas sp. EM1]|eukprot:CCW65868.1 unnamed protein product [Phytomonas sp. isolate EM1]